MSRLFRPVSQASQYFEEQRKIVERHHDKRLLWRIILVCFTFLFAIAWLLTLTWESTRVVNLLSRMSESAITLITGAAGALFILMRGREDESRTRSSDNPLLPPVVAPPPSPPSTQPQPIQPQPEETKK